MISIKTIIKKIYCVTGSTKNNYRETRVTRIPLPSKEYTEWVWNRIYEIDINDKNTWDELCKNCVVFENKIFTVDVLNYLSKAYFNNKQLGLRVKGGYWYPDKLRQNLFTEPLQLFVIDDKKECQPTSKDKAAWAEKERKLKEEKACRANTRIIKNIFAETIKQICEPYGIELDIINDSYCNLLVRNNDVFAEMVIKTLKENVINKLIQYGLELELDENKIKQEMDSLYDILKDNPYGCIRVKQ